MSKIKAKGTNLLVKKVKQEDKTSSGIILSQEPQETNTWEIIDFGEDTSKDLSENNIKEVYLGNHTIYNIDDNVYCTDESNIIAYVNN